MGKPIPIDSIPSPGADTTLDNYSARVVELMSDNRGRGRPPTGTAKSNAERQRAYRERQKKAKLDAVAAVVESPSRNEKREALIAELNRENDALAIKVDQLQRTIKAKESEIARMCKRQDELVADLAHLRSRVARWKAQDGSETTEEPIRPKGWKGHRKA